MADDGNSGEPRGQTYRVDPDQSISEAIIYAVADASGCPPLPESEETGRDIEESLDPLYRAIDPDALESLFSSSPAERERDIEVSFSYHDRRITVESSGTIRIEPPE